MKLEYVVLMRNVNAQIQNQNKKMKNIKIYNMCECEYPKGYDNAKSWILLTDLLDWIKQYETSLGDLPKELKELKDEIQK